MPILKINILGSTIEINYQENEKEKLLHLIQQFKLRLSEFKDIKGRFSDNKIIFLAALKAEDNIFELKQILDSQKKIIDSSYTQKEQIGNKIREIVNLKDQISSLDKKNKILEEQNRITMNGFEKLNKKLISLIDKIISANNNNDNDNDN
tara:strand:+ start:487 stop:936 length:450 start_codon:yes stop_codon:yes gene_type:complete